ncbi:MAG: flagellar biosynthesis protein FlhF [Eubacterium sp.]|nr:flagellar biosynthesis protein FlhF [Eubacterium sp.]MCM1216227.1 flagellar biosynthesis protein FlhF [Lachnospiraceae bacterium]MCM1238845.1 flagellar biosynthesis protein FlhF [Lachnospiraceae bacterium]
MIIKKFVGKTEEEAVESAKKELGGGIVIMNVKDVKPKGLASLFRSRQVEVTVALEEEGDIPKPVRREVSAPEPVKSQDAPVVDSAAMTAAAERSQNIEKRLDSLQTLLESRFQQDEAEKQEQSENAQLTEKPEEELSEEEQERSKFVRLLYNTMLENEVDEKYANQIIEELERNKKPNMPFDYILANVYQKLILKFGKAEGITPAEKGPKIVLFLGPTGVGKTTTIAKLASVFTVVEKKKVALLTADTYRIAAAEQLRTYANILEVPFRVIYTDADAGQAVDDFRNFDYIFVDTAGHSHKNEEQLENIQKLYDAVKEAGEYQTFLVLSATTKYRDLTRIASGYKEITEYQLIFTKLDETLTLGNLLNLKLYADVPIAYVTCGQNVPDDIERFNPQKMVKQLLGGKA